MRCVRESERRLNAAFVRAIEERHRLVEFPFGRRSLNLIYSLQKVVFGRVVATIAMQAILDGLFCSDLYY